MDENKAGLPGEAGALGEVGLVAMTVSVEAKPC